MPTDADSPPTTLLKRREEMPRRPLPHCHGGAGALDFTAMLEGGELRGRHLRFLHDDTLAPGVSIGVHDHAHEEYYVILSGEGHMTLDGTRFPVRAGDVTAVYPGGSHGLENTSDDDLRILVIGLP
jgi:uncharacterized cupin superfamily protein